MIGIRLWLSLCTAIGVVQAIVVSGADEAARRPVLFLIGDSTVRNNTRGQTGWGQVVAELFDTNRIRVANRALGGRSSRTFLSEGLWSRVHAELKPGDFVLMQFGHNDGGPLDEGKARASLKGSGSESRVVTNKTTGTVETVGTYGSYLRRFITESKAKGATPVVLSPVPRNIWKAGRVVRADQDYGRWAAEAAKEADAAFVDLNRIVANRYDELGEKAVAELFGGDHTHTNEKGARLNAECVAEGLRSLRTCAFSELMLPAPNLDFPKKGRELSFDFARDVAAPGWTLVAPTVAYQHDLGYGFEPGASLTVLTNRAVSPPDKESFTSNTPFLFSAAVPEGNYLVTVFFGAQECRSTNTVKAESRRLMLESVTTVAGQFTQASFCVNVRTPLISSNRSVRLKEREKGVLHWDDKLTLEFNGSRPAVGGVVIRPAEEAITVYLLGDSTVTDQPFEPWNSWGQMLTRFLDTGVAVANHAESGESLRSSLNALRVAKALYTLRTGDYVLIQFGHNDQKDRATNALDHYAQNLRNLVSDVRQRRATPVLITSMERLNGWKAPTLGPYPDAVRRVATEEHVPLIDLNVMSCELYRALGPDLPRAFQDGTHHTAYGSYELARCVVEGMKTAVPALAAHIRPEITSFSPSKPDPFSGFLVPSSPQQSRRKPEGN